MPNSSNWRITAIDKVNALKKFVNELRGEPKLWPSSRTKGKQTRIADNGEQLKTTPRRRPSVAFRSALSRSSRARPTLCRAISFSRSPPVSQPSAVSSPKRCIVFPTGVSASSLHWKPFVKLERFNFENPPIESNQDGDQTAPTTPGASTSIIPFSPNSPNLMAFKLLFNADQPTAINMIKNMILLPTVLNLDVHRVTMSDLAIVNISEMSMAQLSPGQRVLRNISDQIRGRLHIDLAPIHMHLFILELMCINVELIGDYRTFVGAINVNNMNFRFYRKLIDNLKFYVNNADYVNDRFISIDVVKYLQKSVEAI